MSNPYEAVVAKFDLGVGDVHIDGAGGSGKRTSTPEPSSLIEKLTQTFAKKPRYEVANPETRNFRGIPIVIDRPLGFEMTGTDEQGRAWSRTYTVDYGFIPNTNGGDGEGIDVFIGPNPESDKLFVVEQVFADGKPDELKAFVGFDSANDAFACYAAHVPREFARSLHGPIPLSLLRAMKRAPEVLMAEISTKQRKALPESAFADPKNRAYPIHDASHVRNAAARLEQQKSNMSPSEYGSIRRRIARAARKFGVDSEYNKPGARKGTAARLHIRADLAHGGALHVSHHTMSDRLVKIVGHAIQMADAIDVPEGIKLLADEKGKLVWIQVAEPGHFRGHPAGPFTLDDHVFNEIIRNFDRDKLPVPIDYEHASEADPTSGNVPRSGAPAQGWIHKLEHRPGKGLWGLVEWLPQAAEQIKSGAYRFLSPAVRFGAKDRVSGDLVGAKLTSAALTNQPFLKGMEPLMAARDNGRHTNMASFAYSSNEYMPKLRAALRTGDLATPKELLSQLDRLRNHFEAAAFDVSGMSDGIRLADYMHPLREIACAGRMGSTWDEVFDTVEDLIDAAIERHELEYHMPEGAQPEMSVNAAAFDDDEETAMSEQEKAVLMREKAELSLQLKDATARAEAAEAKCKDLEKKFEDQQQKLMADKVAEAFDTYKDTKKLSEVDRESMVLTLKHNPELFDRLYPRVTADKRHLMKEMTSGPSGTPKPQPGDVDFVEQLRSETFAQTTQRLMKDKTLSYEAASSEAFRLRRQLGKAG